MHQINDVLNFIKQQEKNKTILILLKKTKKLNNTISELTKEGYSRILINNQIKRISQLNEKDLKKQDEIYIVVDRIITDEKNSTSEISDSIQTAFKEGEGECILMIDNLQKSFSNRFELDGMNFEQNTEQLFSFNNPYGACNKCEGFGTMFDIDENKIITNHELSVYDGVVECWKGEKLKVWKDRFISNSLKFDFPIHRSYNKLRKEEKDILWNGKDQCKGIRQFFNQLEKKKYKIQNRVLISRYRGQTKCIQCNGSRLRKEALYVKVDGMNIADITNMNIRKCLDFFRNIQLEKTDLLIAKSLIKEITDRLNYLNEVGLSYLTLNRKSNTLSGGESQRIKLATSIGSSLVGAMYIFDEPSIGLHAKDTQQLINILKKLRDLGNSIIIVEHDEDIIRNADEIIDIGPKAGMLGGEITFQGKIEDIKQETKSLTVQYLKNILNIPVSEKRKKLNKYIHIDGVRKNNIKNVNFKIPLNGLVLITGVSGSGKSTLITDVLNNAVNHFINNSYTKEKEYKTIKIDDEINKIEFINQNPIGRSSRSNPVTYIKAYDEIRKLFSEQKISKSREYKTGHFSFNIEGGRCEHCKGEGEKKIEMQFMADIYLKCDNCKGNRFKKEILDVKFAGKNIFDILNLSINEAINLFKKNDQINISKKLQPLKDVGLGYVKLGQSSNTLSGGEAQRIKLAYFLSKTEIDKTLFIFDEPTTGLHIHDIKKLLNSFDHLIEKGHSIICIEHNLDVIKCADWIIDLGPEGGDKGGNIIFEGVPEDIINSPISITGKHLKKKI